VLKAEGTAPDDRDVSPSFKFGLERVRELREHDENRAKEELAASLNQRVRGAAMLAAAADEAAAAAANVPAQPGTRVTGSDLVAHALWRDALERGRETAALHLDRLDTEVHSRRSALGDASRRREVLDRLKERRRQEHVADMQRREGAELDEIAIAAHGRPRGARA
jgi:flagellar FliJ protein